MDPALRRSPGMSAPLRRCRAQSECVYPRREAFKRVLSPRPCPAIHPFVLLAFIVADLLLQASGTLTPHYGTRLSTAARVWRRLPRLDRWAADRFVEHTRHPGGEGGGAEAIDDALRRLVWIEGHRPVCDGADRLSQRLRVTGLDQKRGTLTEDVLGATRPRRHYGKPACECLRHDDPERLRDARAHENVGLAHCLCCLLPIEEAVGAQEILDAAAGGEFVWDPCIATSACGLPCLMAVESRSAV